MNGKFEEKLAQLAFGDVSSEDAARIEAQVGKDPTAQRALAEFRDMREGLRDLAEVPEHQLSNERLRDAILARGLQPEPVKERSQGLGAGWIWMPVAALAIGFGLVMVRPRPAAQAPNLVLNEEISTPKRFDISLPDPKELASAPAFGTTAFKSNSVRKPKVSPQPMLASRKDPETHLTRRHRRHDPRFTPDAEPVKVGNWKPAETLVAIKQSDSTPKAPDNSVQPKNGTIVADNAPIVLIDSNPDAATGAPTATEVGTASNVLIGG